MKDIAVADCIAGEEERQRDGLELIPGRAKGAWQRFYQ